MTENRIVLPGQSPIREMAASMTDVASPGSSSNAGEESNMDDLPYQGGGPSSEISLRSPATCKNGAGMMGVSSYCSYFHFVAL